MKASLKIDDRIVTVDLSRNFDLSILFRTSSESGMLLHAKHTVLEKEEFKHKPSIRLDTSCVNSCNKGTKTQGIGCISAAFYSIHQALKDYVFCAEVISVVPENFGKDYRISKKQLLIALKDLQPTALVIRTLPNTATKKTTDYTVSNWAYLEDAAASYLAEIGVKHLLIDFASIDKDAFQGELYAYKAFWQYPENPRNDCTITERIYVPNEVEDGSYLLNLLIAPFEDVSSPSKPILHPFLKRGK